MRACEGGGVEGRSGKLHLCKSFSEMLMCCVLNDVEEGFLLAIIAKKMNFE
jgi:hypothetical protein